MNKFKRVLSLALTGAMITGLMMVGASAAEFTDAKDIENNDAVNTMVALGVIKGKDTGAFDPKGNVTRAEMAKMLCVAINGGKEPVLGTKAVPTYTDIDGHWAESYIEYCSSMGYVAGRGDGTFGPNASVTSTEAAKMILTAMGYKSDVSGFTGIDWAINTNSQANQAGLYEDLEDIDTTQPMSREDAAQMLYNALDAKAVDEDNGAYKTSTYTYTGSESIAVGSEKVYVFATKDADLETLAGEEFNSYADADAAAKALNQNATLGKDYTLTSKTVVTYGTQSVTKTADETFGHKYLSLNTYDEDNVYLKSVEDDSKGTYTIMLSDGMTYTKVAEDFSSLMGEKVKVLSKKSDDVYGVFASGGAVLATGILGDIDDNTAASTSVDFGSGKYKMDNTTAAKTPVYAFNDFDNVTTTKTLSSLPDNMAAEFKAVDLDDDGKVDLVVYVPFTVVKVTYVGAKSFTAGGVTVKFEDANTYEGMAKNDYAVLVDAANTVDDTDTYSKIDTIVSGDVDATRDNGAKFRIDGTWYTFASSLVTGSEKSVTAGGSVDKAVIVNGYAFFVDASRTVEAKDYAVVVKAVASDDNGMNGDQAKLLFTDGTQKVVDTDADYTSLVGDLVTYDLDDGDYVLTAAETKDADKAGFDSIVSGKYAYAKDGKSTIGDNYIAKDAVIFVEKNNGKYTVITGATLARMAAADVYNAYADEDSATGYETVSLAFIKGDVTSGDMKYGYVTSKISTIKNDDGKVATFTLFNGTEDVEVTTTQTAADLTAAKKTAGDDTATGLDKGVIIAYVDDGDGIEIKNVYVLSKDTAQIGAVNAYNGDDEFSYITGVKTETVGKNDLKVIDATGTKHANVEIDDDTVILTINVADTEGVVDGELALADKTPAENYYANVLVLTTGSAADLIVYCNDILDVID